MMLGAEDTTVSKHQYEIVTLATLQSAGSQLHKQLFKGSELWEVLFPIVKENLRRGKGKTF